MPIPVNSEAPVPSTADYSSRNVAPLMSFFAPIVSAVTGSHVAKEDLKFRYENNTPNNPTDDIFVMHPHRAGDLDYVDPPKPSQKSVELKEYERVAKQSKRLLDYMRSSPARIEYFK